MLDVGLAVGGGGREIEAVGLGQERGEILVDLGAPAAALLDMGIGVARSLAGLDRLHRRGEGDVAGIECECLTSENLLELRAAKRRLSPTAKMGLSGI